MKIVGMAAAALLLGAQVSGAQQPGPPSGPRGPGGMPGMKRMAEHMQTMDSLHARLDTLVSRMNRATGNRKVNAMAEVINEMAAQRKAMHEHMRQMMRSHQGMMMHPAPAEGRRAPPRVTDSAAGDTAHGAHHPPN